MAEALVVDFTTLGPCRITSGGPLTFPPAPLGPGLYRLQLIDTRAATVYIGETVELRRRFHHYERPGPSQTTNIRMQGRIRETLIAGGSVGVAVARAATATSGSVERALDLTNENERRALEAALIEQAVARGEVVENRRI